MGQGRLKGEQLRDQTLGPDELADGIMEARHVSMSGALKALSFGKFYIEEELPEFTIASDTQSFIWPDNGIAISGNVVTAQVDDCIAHKASIEETKARLIIEGTTNRFLITNRQADNTPLAAMAFQVEVTYVSPALVLNDFSLQYSTVNGFRINTGDWVAYSAVGYYLLKDTDTKVFIVLSVLEDPTGGDDDIDVPVVPGSIIGVFNASNQPVEVVAGTYTGKYPAVKDISIFPPDKFFDMQVSGGGGSGGGSGAYLRTVELPISATIDSTSRVIGVISEDVDMPASISTDGEAKKLVQLFINGERQSLDRFSYDRALKQFSWLYAVGDDANGFNIETDDMVEVTYPCNLT